MKVICSLYHKIRPHRRPSSATRPDRPTLGRPFATRRIYRPTRPLRPSRIFAALAVLCSAAGPLALTPQSVGAVGCKDVEFIFARGSGEALGTSPSYTNWKSNITEAIADLDLAVGFYELGSATQGGFRYPAVAVSGGVHEFFTMLGTFISAGNATEFNDSVVQGMGELKSYIERTASACPQTKFVLGGYSQGAMVLTKSLAALDPSRITYVATFGDPKLYLPEGKRESLFRQPAACYGRDLSEYRTHVPDCKTYEGILTGQKPYQPGGYTGKIGTWCNGSDIMCSSGLSVGDHSGYVDGGLYRDASRMIRSKLIAAFPGALTYNPLEGVAIHDVLFLFDSTGSMGSMIKVYREEAERLGQLVTDSGGRIGLYTYNELSNKEYPEQLCQLGCHMSTFKSALEDIKPHGGGDAPESLLSGLMYAMNTADWTPGATKSIVVLTDALYHETDTDPATGETTTLPDVVQRSLEIDPVNVYVLNRSGFREFYQPLVTGTNGQFFDYESERIASTDFIYRRPVALLSAAEYSGETGGEFHFDAGASYGFGAEALRFDWDLDGDGVFELTDAGAAVDRTYTEPFSDFIQVRVSDELGSSTMSAKVTVVPYDESRRLPSITRLGTEKIDDSTAVVTFEADAERVFVVLDDAVVGTVAVTPGENYLTIGELAHETTLTLVPYTAETRGESRSVTLLGLNQPEPTVPMPTPTAPSTGAYDRRLLATAGY